MSAFRWAVIGPGGIARRFAAALPHVAGAELRWVLGRDMARAQGFADAAAEPGHVPAQAVADLAGLLAQPELDGVYIATPHAQHGDLVRQCLLANKAVLCEKPLVPNLAQAEALVELARQRQVFLMEAVWTRFLPVYKIVQAWLQEQAIGRLCGIQSSFCFNAPFDPSSRVYDPVLAGGALLDIGIYNLTMTRWVLQQALGACPEPLSIQASGLLAPTGVDQRVCGMLNFPGGLSSQFICAVDGFADNGLRIFGERGHISLNGEFSSATQAFLHRHGEPPLQVHAPLRFNGFESEIEETQACARGGLIESPVVPHAETLATLAWMDEIRRQLGVRYPFE
ncbi:Gfo/Idh/MocA family oxidoreductase [Paucibacter sp. TC2R-5]|uniref:Gfo/Idh/MocA family protein n=1 Tax=Paucibacter sp. TC2R-5 TaxID=2893555 RepID=UPI0021E4A8AB|nr:Gfo/Idh/MocA family oxidoreductase [Paucibacter sp. TC2R-5]MCV2358462.1 Gfo/Idh/MocA family oxidoreductase [Paucibacter sp. TC2R-5]